MDRTLGAACAVPMVCLVRVLCACLCVCLFVLKTRRRGIKLATAAPTADSASADEAADTLAPLPRGVKSPSPTSHRRRSQSVDSDVMDAARRWDAVVEAMMAEEDAEAAKVDSFPPVDRSKGVRPAQPNAAPVAVRSTPWPLLPPRGAQDAVATTTAASKATASPRVSTADMETQPESAPQPSSSDVCQQASPGGMATHALPAAAGARLLASASRPPAPVAPAPSAPPTRSKPPPSALNSVLTRYVERNNRVARTMESSLQRSTSEVSSGTKSSNGSGVSSRWGVRLSVPYQPSPAILALEKRRKMAAGKGSESAMPPSSKPQ